MKEKKLIANAVGAFIGRPHFEEHTPTSPTAYTNPNTKHQTLTSNVAITLIALVITIIVMLILVAVTVTVAIKGGLFSTAKQSTTDTQYHADREMLLSAVIGAINNDAEVDFTKLDANLPQGFKGTQGEYTSEAGNTFYVDKNGNITDEKVEEAERPAIVAKLKAGQYVNYVYKKGDGTQETIPCIVLYDDAYNTKHELDYGIQLVSSSIVGDLYEFNFDSSGLKYWDSNMGSKIDLEQYHNEKVCSSVRILGSRPDSGDSYVINGEDSSVEDDLYSIKDYKQLEFLQLCNSNRGSCWLLSERDYYSDDQSGNCCHIFYIDPSGVLRERFAGSSCDSDYESYNTSLGEMGFRLCFNLIPEVKIIGGSGAESDPYQLDI